MKKTHKPQATAASPSLAKLKKEVLENILHTELHLFTFKPDHFNETISSPQGFGAQDLKPAYLNLYLHLLGKHKGKLVVKMEENKSVGLYLKN